MIGRHCRDPHDAGSGDAPRVEDARPGPPQVGRPDLDARGLPVPDRVPAGRTYLLALASVVCGIASVAVGISDAAANGKLPGYQFALGMLSGFLALVLAAVAIAARVKKGQGDERIGVAGWIAVAGSLTGCFGVVMLMVATAPPNASFS